MAVGISMVYASDDPFLDFKIKAYPDGTFEVTVEGTTFETDANQIDEMMNVLAAARAGITA